MWSVGYVFMFCFVGWESCEFEISSDGVVVVRCFVGWCAGWCCTLLLVQDDDELTNSSSSFCKKDVCISISVVSGLFSCWRRNSLMKNFHYISFEMDLLDRKFVNVSDSESFVLLVVVFVVFWTFFGRLCVFEVLFVTLNYFAAFFFKGACFLKKVYFECW